MLRGRRLPSAVAMVLLIAAAWWAEDLSRERRVDDAAAARGRYEGVCVQVLDGDTLEVRADSGETFRLRLLGVDCMETRNEEKLREQARRLGRPPEELRRMGERATARTRGLVLNRRVTWEVPEGTPLFDPYDRMLAYVDVDGRDLGEILLREGLAETRRDPHPRAEAYRRLAGTLRAGG